MQKGNTGKNELNRKSYRCFNGIACNIHVEEFLSATHYTLSSYRHCFRGSAATRRRCELNLSNLSDPVWCHGSILWYHTVWRWETQYPEMMLEDNIAPTFQHIAKMQIAKFTFFCVALYFARHTILPQKIENFYTYYLLQLPYHLREMSFF